MKKEKGVNFVFILYPESLPSDWIDRLETLDIPMEISPLHDKDRLPQSKWTQNERLMAERGEMPYKKPHYHVIYRAKNPVTADAVRKRIKRCLGESAISHVEFVNSIKNTHEYLTHRSKDAIKKKKHLYDEENIVALNGFDVDRYISLDVADKNEIYYKLMDIILDNELQNASELFKVIKSIGYEELGIPSKRALYDVWRACGASLTALMKGFYLENVVQKAKNSDE